MSAQAANQSRNQAQSSKIFPKSTEYLKCGMARLMFTFTLFQLSWGYKVYVKYISLLSPTD